MAKKTSKAAEKKAEPQKATADFTCRTCGGHEYQTIRPLPTTNVHGIDRDGTRYTSIERTIVACVQCRHAATVVTKQYVKSLWKE